MANNEVTIPDIGIMHRMTDLKNVGAHLSENPNMMNILPEAIGKLPEEVRQLIIQEGPILELCCGSGIHLRNVAKMHTFSNKPYELIGVDVNTSVLKSELEIEKKKEIYREDVTFSPVQKDVFEYLASEIDQGNIGKYPLIIFFAADEIVSGQSYHKWKGLEAETQRTFFTAIKKQLHPNGVFAQGYSTKFDSLLKELGMTKQGPFLWLNSGNDRD